MLLSHDEEDGEEILVRSMESILGECTLTRRDRKCS